jgi:hypothetical protein
MNGMSSHTLYTPEVRAAVLAHYKRAAGFIAANFPLAPVEAHLVRHDVHRPSRGLQLRDVRNADVAHGRATQNTDV